MRVVTTAVTGVPSLGRYEEPSLSCALTATGGAAANLWAQIIAFALIE